MQSNIEPETSLIIIILRLFVCLQPLLIFTFSKFASAMLENTGIFIDCRKLGAAIIIYAAVVLFTHIDYARDRHSRFPLSLY